MHHGLCTCAQLGGHTHADQLPCPASLQKGPNWLLWVEAEGRYVFLMDRRTQPSIHILS
jgi:hypothetical protein